MKFQQVCLILLLQSCFFNAFGQKPFTIKIDNQIYSLQKEIILKAGYHELVFNFPKSNKSKILYQYYLQDFENKWIDSEYPSARYTNLSGGEYVFHGRIVEQSLKISAVYTVKIIIKENFWEKWWFWGFVVFSIIGLISLVIYFWFLYDFRQRMKVEAIRERIAADLHDEVGANLNSITFITEMLRKQNTKNGKTDLLLEKISTNSSESAALISDTIWALNPNYDSFEKLIERIKSFALGLLSAKDIAFSIENNLANQSLELSIDQRRNLYLIIKEAINNIAKHSNAKKAFLRIDKTDIGLEIMIEDGGLGFDTSQVSHGNGLKNYQTRAINNQIIVNVNSKIGFGTKVEVSLKTR